MDGVSCLLFLWRSSTEKSELFSMGRLRCGVLGGQGALPKQCFLSTAFASLQRQVEPRGVGVLW